MANEETEDAELGASHRVLQVIDGNNCELIKKEILPVSVSPDFAYYLAQINYNKGSEVIAICGYKEIFCYDIAAAKLFRSVTPQFMNERYDVDAQSGTIRRLELWEDYLIGYAQDRGSFVFNLRKGQPEKVMPFAEFEILEGEQYHSMFLLESKDNTFQAILPSYDANTREFMVNPIFSEPLYLNFQRNPKYQDNRFQLLVEVISDTEKNIHAVDMKNRTKVELPKEVMSMKNTKIIDWLKQRRN